MKKPNKPTNFKKLKDKWYKKLAKSGFVDIENNTGTLSSGVPTKLRSYSQRNVELVSDTMDYYTVVTHFLNTYEFKRPKDKIFWEYYAQGYNAAQIEEILKKTKHRTKRSNIWRSLKALEAQMKKLYVSK